MIVVLVLLGFGLFATALHLWSRLVQAEAEVRSVCARRRLPEALPEMIASSLDVGLAAEADSQGLVRLPVRFREAHDTFRDVGQLLETIGTVCRKIAPAKAQDIAKHIYQLQQTLELPLDEVDLFLQDLLRPLEGGALLGRRIAKIETVAPGALVQRHAMWPLDAGSRVYQPLGVVLLDAEDQVISKAKVLCC